MPELFRSAIKFIQLFFNYIVFFITKISCFMDEIWSLIPLGILFTLISKPLPVCFTGFLFSGVIFIQFIVINA